MSCDCHLICNLNDRETEELASLSHLLDLGSLSNRRDRRIWSLESSGRFSCKSLFSQLTLLVLHPILWPTLFGRPRLLTRLRPLFGWQFMND